MGKVEYFDKNKWKYDAAFAQRLNCYLEKRKLTISAFAAKIGVTVDEVKRYLDGQKPTDAILLNKIAKIFGVSIDEIYNGEPDMNTINQYKNGVKQGVKLIIQALTSKITNCIDQNFNKDTLTKKRFFLPFLLIVLTVCVIMLATGADGLKKKDAALYLGCTGIIFFSWLIISFRRVWLYKPYDSIKDFFKELFSYFPWQYKCAAVFMILAAALFLLKSPLLGLACIGLAYAFVGGFLIYMLWRDRKEIINAAKKILKKSRSKSSNDFRLKTNK